MKERKKKIPNKQTQKTRRKFKKDSQNLKDTMVTPVRKILQKMEP